MVSTPSPSVTGPRPVATSSISTFSASVLPSAFCIEMSTPLAEAVALVTFVPVWVLMPRFLKVRSSSFETASSSAGTSFGMSSMIVTSLP